MTTGALTTLDWAILLGYIGVMLAIGLRFRSRQQTSHRYFLGSGKLPGWAVGMSMFATVISSWAFLALPAKAFQSDLRYLMAVSALPVAAWLAARWLVPFFRERVRLSAYEYLERRFGIGARLYGNLAFLVVHFGKMAAFPPGPVLLPPSSRCALPCVSPCFPAAVAAVFLVVPLLTSVRASPPPSLPPHRSGLGGPSLPRPCSSPGGALIPPV
jgi:hypothetical protein